MKLEAFCDVSASLEVPDNSGVVFRCVNQRDHRRATWYGSILHRHSLAATVCATADLHRPAIDFFPSYLAPPPSPPSLHPIFTPHTPRLGVTPRQHHMLGGHCLESGLKYSLDPRIQVPDYGDGLTRDSHDRGQNLAS
ncbi:hypothetical protein E2C01_046413 [Portunus trituberculatus]|uniref:Uncharacterized protein n=1 Tax=Portunus trituberculatus TaxID=210409 RepID=A0A5B7G0W5_PORTR|nr:hypothetical protein [Portunus trituberculatus]